MTRSIARVLGSSIGAFLVAMAMVTVPATSNAALFVSVTIAPPPLPVYEQPLIPGPGYIWTPGYWAWGPEGYYWVPGTWVEAPFVGALWTPGYWGWGDGGYFWHAGYWGLHVGFYGGIFYGFGYTGVGYQGGYWEHEHFRYNRTVNNVNVTNITNTYNTTVVNNGPATHVSYNGGSGGVIARPTPQDRIADRERHTALLPVQAHHELAASSNRALLASVNNGRPAVAATARPQQFAAERAPARSFSQQAAAAPVAAPPRGGAAAVAPRATNQPRLETRSVPANIGPARVQPAPGPQAFPRPPSERPQGAPQAQMRPQAPPHPQALAQPQRVPPQQGETPREGRATRGGADERLTERQR